MHKVPGCVDTAMSQLILVGSEDATIRLWDTRLNSTKGAVSSYENHTRGITQVQFNPKNENVFVSGSLDGTVKLWDLRNDEVPLANLKQNQKKENKDFKIFAVEWNGASQILSGGSDSHISMHSMNSE